MIGKISRRMYKLKIILDKENNQEVKLLIELFFEKSTEKIREIKDFIQNSWEKTM